MTLGARSYGSSAYAGGGAATVCSAPRANLVVMENLLKIGYTQDEIMMLYSYIDQT